MVYKPTTGRNNELRLFVRFKGCRDYLHLQADCELEMSSISTELLATLMMPRSKRPKVERPLDFSEGFALVRTENGLEKIPIKQAKASLQRFEGKQGSIRRSAKGRTRIMPNGYVKYNAITELDVVSYHIAK